MAGITLEQAATQLAAWLSASIAVATNQSYTVGDRSVTKADAAYIQTQIVFWDKQVKRLSVSTGGFTNKVQFKRP